MLGYLGRCESYRITLVGKTPLFDFVVVDLQGVRLIASFNVVDRNWKPILY